MKTHTTTNPEPSQEGRCFQVFGSFKLSNTGAQICLQYARFADHYCVPRISHDSSELKRLLVVCANGGVFAKSETVFNPK